MTQRDLFEPERTSELSQWMSPTWIARRLACWVPVEASGYVLEPSAGSGQLVEGLIRAGWPVERIVAVEIDGRWCAHLRERFPGLRVIEGDFLALAKAWQGFPPRHVLTNPPYEGGADVAFLEASLRLVGPLGSVCALVKTDIEYSSGRMPLWRDTARVERRARLVERPAFGRHVDGEKVTGAERNYVGLELALRSSPRAVGAVELVAEEAWSRTDPESAWTRSVDAAEPAQSPTKQGEGTDRQDDANRQEAETNRGVTNEEGPR